MGDIGVVELWEGLTLESKELPRTKSLDMLCQGYYINNCKDSTNGG